MPRLLALFLALMILFPSSAFCNKAIWHGPRDSEKVALTFDDGPSEIETLAILKLLKNYNAKASFFVVGKPAHNNPHLIREIHYRGHELANHSYAHHRLDTLTDLEIENELLGTNTILEQISGQKAIYFRPPGGRYNQRVLDIAHKLGLKVALWDVNAGDYKRVATRDKNGLLLKTPKVTQRSAERIAKTVIDNSKGGSILLFHNVGGESLKALPIIIETLQKRGLRFVTLSELLGKG